MGLVVSKQLPTMIYNKEGELVKNKYLKGKVYTIKSKNSNDVYIGSTCQTLSQRMSKHKSGKYKCKSTIVFDSGDAYIELIENYPCKSEEELRCRERFYIENTTCVNKEIPGRTKKEYNIMKWTN